MDDLLLLRELGRDAPLLDPAELAPARDRLRNAMISHSAGTARPAGRSWAARRVVLAGVATAGVAAAVVALLTVAPIDRPSGGTVQPSAAVVSPSPPEDFTFRLVADSVDSAQATATQLSQALDRALKKEAPGARWIFKRDNAGQTPGPDGQPPQLHVKASDGAKKSEEMFSGGTGVLHEGRRGALHLLIFTSVGSDRGIVSCPADSAGCIEVPGPNGGKAVVQTISQPPMRGSNVPFRMYMVGLQLADGRALSLSHSNDFGPDMTPAAQRDTPLTREQVTAIAFDVASKIKP